MTWQDWADHEAKRVRDAEQWRRPRDLDLDSGADGPTGVVDDRNVVSFASNDYLGLTRHPAVVAAAHDALDRWGTGSGSARPDRRLAAGAHRARRRGSRTGRAPSAPCSSPPDSPPTSG